MKKLKLFILFVMAVPLATYAENVDTSGAGPFYKAKQHLENMLAGKEEMCYENAIYQIENAWYNKTLDSVTFHDAIDHHIRNIEGIIKTKRIEQKFTADLLQTATQKRVLYENALANYAIFSYMTDTSFKIREGNVNFVFDQRPYKYSFNDPLGTKDWRNTQVTNLIITRRGNCFALASLFKILSDRLESQATLCTAPEHIYIRHADNKGVKYNVEVAGKCFPGAGTIETLTYTSDEAAKNSIAIRELNTKQSIAICLVYLAKGYEYKFNTKSNDFIFACAELALQYDPNNLNAMLLKAEVLEQKIAKEQKIEQLQLTKDFRLYQEWITTIYNSGYREMPYEMKNILTKGWMKDTLLRVTWKDNTPRHSTSKVTAPTRYASLSWGLFDEEIRTKPLERYGNTIFNTKTKKIVAFVKSDVLFNQYTFDPVVFALNVDPMAYKLPGWSPYTAFANNPISNFDPDGAFPYSVHVRSFAPFETFGGGFEGDNRGYSTTLSNRELGGSGGVTSRLQQAFIVDPTARTVAGGTAWSDPSSHPLFGSKTATDDKGGATAIFTGGQDGATANVSAKMSGHLPLIPSADIDVNSGLRLTENVKAGVLNVDATMNGDKFPSAELFIGDSKGQQVMAITSGYLGNPYSSLPGDNKLQMGSGSFQIKINSNGEFQGVTQGDKTYSIQDWNKMQTAHPIAVPEEKPMPPR